MTELPHESVGSIPITRSHNDLAYERPGQVPDSEPDYENERTDSQHEALPPATWGNRNNEELIAAFGRWQKRVRHRADTTIRTYASTLHQYSVWRDGKSLMTATRPDMEAFITRTRTKRAGGNEGQAATQAKDVAILRSFYEWSLLNRYVHYNPALALYQPKVSNKNPRPVPEPTWIKLWGNAPTDLSRVVMGLGYFCGLRRYELIGLKPEQLTTKWGTITNFVRKGGGEDTLRWDSLLKVYQEKLPNLLISRDLFELSLDRILNQRTGRPLVIPYANEDAVNKRLSYWCRTIGVEHITPHQLRHSAATNLVAAGVPLHIVKEVMNHQSIDVTMRYVKTRGDELDDWLKGR